MRNVLIILGLALAAILVSVLIQRPKELNPAPQDVEAARKDAEIRADQEKARKMGLLSQPPANPEFAPSRDGVLTATMSVEGRGDVVFELYPKAAPRTVARVASLIRSGFYNGIRFHRVVRGNLVQAGDPGSKKFTSSQLASMTEDQVARADLGKGGSGQSIRFEDSKLPNVTGSIAMALAGERSDTADSQFYINLKDNRGLDGSYCVFGRVTRGMDVLGNLQQGDTITRLTISP